MLIQRGLKDSPGLCPVAGKGNRQMFNNVNSETVLPTKSREQDYSWTRRGGLCVCNIDAWCSHTELIESVSQMSNSLTVLFTQQAGAAEPKHARW